MATMMKHIITNPYCSLAGQNGQTQIVESRACDKAYWPQMQFIQIDEKQF